MMPGTGAAWENRYKGTYRGATNGLHHFNAGAKIQRLSDGMYGQVLSRTALTATVRMADSSIHEIQQLSEEFICRKERKL